MKTASEVIEQPLTKSQVAINGRPFLRGENLSNMRLTNKKKGNFGQRELKQLANKMVNRILFSNKKITKQYKNLKI